MKHWANTQLRDKRTKPATELKQKKTYRLPLSTLKKRQELVQAGKYKDQTSAIEAAVAKL